MSSTLPKIDFTEDEAAVLLEHTRQIAEAVLKHALLPGLPDPLASVPAYGVFVTFRRQGELRACRGRFGSMVSLGELLAGVVADTVLDDPRFPVLTADELPYLQCELSLMHSPREIHIPAEDRPAAIQTGRHGVVLSHAEGRALLLPQVAVENRWTAQQLLAAVSQKAGLPADGWQSPRTELLTFEARVFDLPPLAYDPSWTELTEDDFERLRDIIESVSGRGSQSAGHLSTALTRRQFTECGLAVKTQSGRLAVSLGKDLSLSQLAARVGQSMAKDPEARQVVRITVFGRPLELRAADHPHRHGSLVNAVVVVRAENRWSLQLPGPGAGNPVVAALAAFGISATGWRNDAFTRVTAFGSVRTQAVQPATERTRPPARAGQFYPRSPDELKADVQRYLAMGDGPVRNCRAVLLPHAGWMYCGGVIGQTLSRTAVPRTVIIVGPKHTPHGADWSVSSADTWAWPGGEAPVARDLRERLLSLVPGLAAEADAHQQEHAVEVLVPFLAARQPQLRILPIVLGPTSYSQTERLARGLAALMNEAGEPLLLVISSDLNHFAPEPENRRRDLLAIGAFCTGDPGALFDTVTQNDISMCGVIPAVTVLRALHETRRPPRVELVCYANSASVSGDTQRVVGYAGCLVE